MEDISRLIGQIPQWIQPKFSQRRFELRTAAETLAGLEFKSAFGSLATGALGAGRWTFKRVGFFSPRVTVRTEGAEADLAIYTPRWTGTEGTLALSGGPSYTWKVANFWSTRFVFLDPGGQPLVTFHQGVEDPGFSDAFKVQARVEISEQARGLADLSLLVLLGFYLMILHQDDSAAAAGAVAASA
jgi:hypothetical protein